MRRQCPIKAQLHHEGLRVRELLLLAPVKRQGDEEVLAEDALNYLKVLVRVIGLAQSLLSCSFIHASVH